MCQSLICNYSWVKMNHLKWSKICANKLLKASTSTASSSSRIQELNSNTTVITLTLWKSTSKAEDRNYMLVRNSRTPNQNVITKLVSAQRKLKLLVNTLKRSKATQKKTSLSLLWSQSTTLSGGLCGRLERDQRMLVITSHK